MRFRAGAQIDKVDMHLIEALSKDGRLSNRDLARLIDLSESACAARVRKLEHSGVIIGYRACISLNHLGTYVSAIDVSLRNDAPDTYAAFERIVMAEPEIVALAMMEDDYQYRLDAACGSHRRCLALIQRLQTHSAIVRDVRRIVMIRGREEKLGLPVQVLMAD